MAKKMRCTFCNKKTGLINFTCKCEGIFCSLHRYTHMHACPLIEEKKKDRKESEINRLSEEQMNLKDEIDKNKEDYEKIIDNAADQIENFIKKVNSENQIQ